MKGFCFFFVHLHFQSEIKLFLFFLFWVWRKKLLQGADEKKFFLMAVPLRPSSLMAVELFFYKKYIFPEWPALLPSPLLLARPLKKIIFAASLNLFRCGDSYTYVLVDLVAVVFSIELINVMIMLPHYDFLSKSFSEYILLLVGLFPTGH